MEEAATQERVGQLFLIVRRDNDDRPVLCLDRLTGFVNEELHAVQLDEKIIRELDVSLVDLVDQQHNLLIGGKRFPELAALDVLAYVLNLAVPQLRVSQPRHSVVLVQALLCLSGRFDVPLDQLFAQTRGYLLRQHGFSRTGLTLNQQGPLKRYRGVNRHPQIVRRDVPLCTFKLHNSPLLCPNS